MQIPAHPVVYEINTWVWLGELRRKYGAELTLGSVPAEEWDALATLGMDVIWLMGVWQRSPEGRQIALHNDGLLAEFMRVLPDFLPEDVVGSPYCIRGYEVDERLGGREGLAGARQSLADRGVALLLDFVPNHVAPDHPWTLSHPEYFIQGSQLDQVRDPQSWLANGEQVFARGRDPYFPAWQDVVQLNAFAPGLRAVMAVTLLDIASQCDGVRCDMAMLMINEIFASTWGERAGDVPASEYWDDLIGAVKQHYPHFLWMAEAYWDKEADLHRLGFDYCYDKILYDRLVIPNLGSAETTAAVVGHLWADAEYQRKLVRFVENHDEPRAALAFPAERLRATSLVALTQMGARLLHEGQLEGRRTKVTVFLGRRPSEEVDAAIGEYLRSLMATLRAPVLHTGRWQLCGVRGGMGTALAWCWFDEASGGLALLAANLGDAAQEVEVLLPVASPGKRFRLTQRLPGEALPPIEWDGAPQDAHGIVLRLEGWGAQFWLG